MNELFLIDTNSLITPYLNYYPFDLAMGFWSQMETHIKNGTIIILDLVKSEIEKGTDDLSGWIKRIEIGNYLDRRQEQIINYYSAILQSISDNPCYQDSALREWSNSTIADAWLIAAAAAFGYTLVTFEKSNANLSSHNPSRKAKIPDVAMEFGVKTENLYYMMRELGFSL